MSTSSLGYFAVQTDSNYGKLIHNQSTTQDVIVHWKDTDTLQVTYRDIDNWANQGAGGTTDFDIPNGTVSARAGMKVFKSLVSSLSYVVVPYMTTNGGSDYLNIDLFTLDGTAPTSRSSQTYTLSTGTSNVSVLQPTGNGVIEL